MYCAMCDGSDYWICKVANNTLQSHTWSVKNYHNRIRFLVFGALNGMPIISLPLNGMYSSGRHSDNHTFDHFMSVNEGGIADILPLMKTIGWLDRGFMNSSIVAWTNATTLLPCLSSIMEKYYKKNVNWAHWFRTKWIC